MLAAVSSGHPDLSDWLLLVAFIVFVLAAVLAAATTVARPAWLNAAVLQLAGLALLALAWLVL